MNRTKRNNSEMVKNSECVTETEMTSDVYRLITNEEKPPDIKNEKENSWIDAVQMFASFLLAGFGMVAASLLLDVVQHWQVFEQVSEVIF